MVRAFLFAADVALIDQVLLIRDVETDPTTIKDPEVIIRAESTPGAADGLPTYTHHGWRYMTADPVRRKLAIAIGAPCNVPGIGAGGVFDCASELPANNVSLRESRLPACLPCLPCLPALPTLPALPACLPCLTALPACHLTLRNTHSLTLNRWRRTIVLHSSRC